MKGIILALLMIAALVDCSRADGPGSLDLVPLTAETAKSQRVVLTVLQDEAVKGSQAGDKFAPQLGSTASVRMAHQQRKARFIACYVPLEKSFLTNRTAALEHLTKQGSKDFYLLTGSDMSEAKALENKLTQNDQQTAQTPKKPIASPLQTGLASRPLSLTNDGRIKIWTEADFTVGILYDPITKTELATLSTKQGETQ